MAPYRRFALMIAVSTLLMYGLMYLNTFEPAHVRFSQTRAWMALVMGSAMAAVMLLFMWAMYENRRLNLAILAVCALVFAGALGLVRSQALVDDVAYMKAMIPHHSIAVLTSERAHIDDPRVRRLADGIVATQLREIAEMEALVADLEAHSPQRGEHPEGPDHRSPP
jgi:uncharacterized protein (DUF305 family)